MPRTLDADRRRFGLRTPFRISRGVKTEADVIEVAIGQDGRVGRGEGVPYRRYGETVEEALAAIHAVAPMIRDGASRSEVNRAMPAGAARNAVDCALWDLEARLAGTSVAALAGLAEARPVASAITIGLDAPDAMAAVAARSATVPLLKVKVTRDDAAAQISAVRAAAPDPRLIVDPNESWTMAEVEGLQDFLVAHRVDLLEQPLPAGEDNGLVGFTPHVPVCADEALHTRADLIRLAGRYDYVNIKLDKTGGLTEALALAEAAREHGFGLMIGCMVCSSLGIAPALLLASATGAAFVDLDGPLWLSQDRAGGVVDRAGTMSPASAGFWGDAA